MGYIMEPQTFPMQLIQWCSWQFLQHLFCCFAQNYGAFLESGWAWQLSCFSEWYLGLWGWELPQARGNSWDNEVNEKFVELFQHSRWRFRQHVHCTVDDMNVGNRKCYILGCWLCSKLSCHSGKTLSNKMSSILHSPLKGKESGLELWPTFPRLHVMGVLGWKIHPIPAFSWWATILLLELGVGKNVCSSRHSHGSV